MKRPFSRAYEIFARHREQLNARRAGAVAQDGSQLTLFAKESAVKGSLYIYETIGDDWWTGGGVTAKKVRDALAEMDGIKTLDVFINSPGGDVFEAKAILTQLQRLTAEKVVHIDGIAASAATFIAMAGDRIITASHANWMIHEASAIAFGRAAEMRDMADTLDLQNQDMAKLYAAQTGKTEAEILDLMAAETWMSAQEALDMGFTDEVAEPDPEEEDGEAKASASTPLVAAAELTALRLRDMRAARRVQDIKNRSGQAPESQRAAAGRQRATHPNGVQKEQ